MIRLDQLVGVAEREAVVRVDVEPPEQLFLPGRQRLGADRADVGRASAGTSIFSCSSVLTTRREARDDVGIFGVAQEGDAGHRQVML